MVEGFATVFGGLNEHAEVVDNVLLSAEIVEFERAQGFLKLFLGGADVLVSYIKIVWHIYSLLSYDVQRYYIFRFKPNETSYNEEPYILVLTTFMHVAHY